MSDRRHFLKILLAIPLIILVVVVMAGFYSVGFPIAAGVGLMLALALFAASQMYGVFRRSSRRGDLRDRNLTSPVPPKSEKQFRNAFEFASVGIAIVSPTRQFLRVNRALADMLGFKPDMLLESALASVVIPEDLDALERHLGQLVAGSVGSFHATARVRHVNQKKRDQLWVRMSVSLVREANELPAYFIFHFEDVTDRQRAEDRLLHQKLYDPLTDLPNRFLFLDRLGVALTRVRRDPNSRLTVFQIDFDRFKAINDRLGRHSGDAMLTEAAQRLRSIVRAANTVARPGADEFSVFIEDGNFDEVLSIVGRIRQELSRPYDIGGEAVYTSISVGIAVGSPEYESAEYLLRDANTALKHAKMAGRDRYEIFVEEMHSQAIEFVQMETDLRHALERNEFKLLYQPIVTLETGILAGFESLVRWHHPTRGLVSPVEFIPVAESTGQIIPIGNWILRESCRQLKAWQAISERAADLWISVNVSSIQFVDFDLVSLVANALQLSGLEPRCLKLEITESTMVENVEYVVAVMERLKGLGVKLSIDDFGTGFSSLSMLHRFPLDSLKIDRSFVSQIKDAETPVEIVKTIVNLASSMNLEIIAEGVETIEQLSQLRRLGCQFGQGFCFAVPLDAVTVDELVGNSPAASSLDYLLPKQSQSPQQLNVG